MTREPEADDIEEDPRIANVYRRMRMLAGVSLLVMSLGFAVVFGVIIYRLTREAPPGDGAFIARSLGLPPGAEVRATAADAGRLYVTVQEGGRTVVHILDGQTLQPLARLDIGVESGGAASGG